MKNRVFQLLCFSMTLLLFAGCIESEDTKAGNNGDNGNNGNNTQLTKEQAREMKDDVMGGRDLCEDYSWYGDGECDDFCPKYDEADCVEEPSCASGADCADTEVCVDGVCEAQSAFCGGIAGILCPSGQYCKNEEGVCGIADQSGTCASIPSGCDDDYTPVCGCDGTTYSNACEAATVGASIESQGACAPACSDSSPCASAQQCVEGVCVTQCGGFLGNTCSETEYCAYVPAEMCGAADASSVCLPRPEGCNKNYAPVCGCDQVTYGNACQANEAGQGIMSEGACETNGACGTRGGITCAEGQFCKFEESAICGATDLGGSCEPIPQFCPDIYLPVCGCDQKTYSNDCEAYSAGVSVSAKGACAKTCDANNRCDTGNNCVSGVCVPSEICGGIIGLQCAANYWCDFPDTVTCGIADFQGACVLRPQACPLVYDPVCGCNGHDYGNACLAHTAGVDVMASGTCAP